MSAALARKFVVNADILLARDMHANTEINDVGSPDSGYSTNSPRSLASENSQLAVDISAPKRKPSTSEEQKLLDRISGGTTREQTSSRDNKVTRICVDKAVPSCHRQQKSTHKRRSLKRSCAEDDVQSSPVLGIKILPEPTSRERSALDERKQSNGNAQSFKGERSSSDKIGTRFEGAFTCRLCSKNHENALLLAQHQCPRIVNVRYECSECGKSFGCPANLASHKRWHKPKEPTSQQPVAMNNQSELKRRRMSPEPTQASTQSSEAAASFHKAGQHLPAIAEPSQGRSTPSPSQGKVRKAIHPCPGCKRRFRRESNRRKHALVKHGIVIAADTPCPNVASSTPPPPPIADGDKSTFKTGPVLTSDRNDFVHCNLTTLALAAEALNRNITAGKTGKTTSPTFDVMPSRAIEPGPDLGKPLDLSTTSGCSKAPLRHGVDQILNLSIKATVKVPTEPAAASKDLPSFAPQWPSLPPGYALKNVQALNNCYGWPFAPNGNGPTSLFTDYRYLAAMAAERMLSCQYRM